MSNEEKKLLESLSVSALRFLSKIAEDKDFGEYQKLVEGLISYEMARTFRLPENEKLVIEHAYSRGRVAGYTESGRLMLGARAEIERREAKRKENR